MPTGRPGSEPSGTVAAAVGGVEQRLREAGVDEQLVDLLHVGVVVAEGAVLVFDLGDEDGAAAADLQRREFLAKAIDPACGGLHERRGRWSGAAMSGSFRSQAG